jgi:hypothetical protein
LLALNFTQNGRNYSKIFVNGAILKADFANEKLVYPNGLIINEQQTCNFKAAENFAHLR